LSVNNKVANPSNFAICQARRRRTGELIPGEVHLEITHRCNLMCFHCYLEYYNNGTQLTELSASEWARVMKQLFETGVFHVTFSGGEPLCRPDIFQIMNHAREIGLFYGLKTNGVLITESVADRLKELSLNGVDVSLYGARPTTHEYVTRVEGSYARTIHAIKLLRERKIKVRVKTSMMKCNAGEHREIENIAQQLDAEFSPDPIIFPKVGEPGSADYIRMDDEQLRTLISERDWIPDDTDDMMSDLKRHLICGAGRTRCAISPQGEVFPCTLWRIPLGDLRQQTFKDIWHGETVRGIRAIEVSDMPDCVNCELVNYCARCPGLVYIENSGISGPSSENCRLARAIKGVIDDREKENLCKPHNRVRTG